MTPPPHAAGVWKRVPDATRVAVRPIHYARKDKRRRRIGLRRRFSSLVRRCVGSRSRSLLAFRPSVRSLFSLRPSVSPYFPSPFSRTTLTLCFDSLKVK